MHNTTSSVSNKLGSVSQKIRTLQHSEVPSALPPSPTSIGFAPAVPLIHLEAAKQRRVAGPAWGTEWSPQNRADKHHPGTDPLEIKGGN